jgi:hypothetical protein
MSYYKEKLFGGIKGKFAAKKNQNDGMKGVS